MTMEMIPQAVRMWAVAITYAPSAEPGSENETATSAGLVVGWQMDPEITEDDRHAVLTPLIAWFDGLACSTDGSVTAPDVDLCNQYAVIAYGETRGEATRYAQNLISGALPGWRRMKAAE